MAAKFPATVKVIGTKKDGKIMKFEGRDAAGGVLEYAMSPNNSDGIAPEINETVQFEYSPASKEYQGKQEITNWVDDWHPGAPFPESQNGQQETADPKKAVNSYDEPEIRKERNIAMSVCVKAAVDYHSGMSQEVTDQTLANTALKLYSCYSDFHLEFKGADPTRVTEETREAVEATPADQVQRTRFCVNCGQETHTGDCEAPVEA